eukprot:2402919-Prymnesium_polylepis.1
MWGDGVVVSALGAGSAEEEGVHVGDVLISVNDVAVHEHASAIAEIHRTIGPTATLCVQGSTRKI